jgi:putative peptide zinc metalloprotease protein
VSNTTVTTAAGSPQEPAAGVGVADAPLARADGVQLLGELDGSGYREAPALVRRADGQTIQLTPLLYAVLEAIDGHRTPGEVAEVVAEKTNRGVTADNVATLVQSQLRPLGLLRLADGSEPEVKKSNPLLGLRFKYVVTDPAKTRRLTAPFAALFAPVVVVALTLAFLATSGWVLFEKGLAAATHQAFDRPGLLLLVFAVTILSAGFHEFGHAAACRYGGATPGAMGAGLYLVWPAFYTEVTDSYRLGRAGRVRVDLGGLYFNAVVAVVMFGVWAATRFDALLLIIAAQVLQMIRQLAPFVRFDGYHILADLTGVPDLYSRIKPTLKGLLPTQWGRPETKVLKPWARAVVSAWVLIVVPLLVASLALMVVAFPRVAATAWDAIGREADVLGEKVSAGDPVGITLQILSIAALALPVLATVYLVVRLVRRTAVGVWRSTEGKPARRTAAAVTALAVVAALAWAWWPRPESYQPIQPTESGTVLTALGVTQAAPARLQEGQVGTAQTLWQGESEPPTKEEPQLALVLVPADESSDAPVWVFPFDRPDAPGPGDNQALAVNTVDGSTVYEVAFALVWADGDTVLNRNEAYALASCRGCKTVAVGFQVVLVVGQADVVVPQNLSAAVNYNCVACVTYALAQQLVITLPEGLSPEANRQLEAVWAQIMDFGRRIREIPVSQIQSELAQYEKQILDIVRADAARTTSARSESSATPTASAPPSASTAPSAPAASSAPSGTASPSAAPTTAPGSTAPSTAEPSTSPTGTGAATSSPTATASP